MRAPICLLVTLPLAWAAPALATPPPDPAAPEMADGDQAAVGNGAPVAEALRQARIELSALERAPAQPAAAVLEGELLEGLPSPTLTSETPAPSPRGAAGRPDIAWLKDLVMPDFPVRWDDRLVELLTYYRDTPRGRAHIRGWLARSGRYRDMIRTRLDQAGLPADLMFVPMVESGFDPGARSAAAAVGMWQFVAPTARDYGLIVDRWADQRLSPEHATDGGIAFFQDLHDKLGSWPLSLAAYNMGYGALTRAIRKYNTNDFWVLSQLEAGLPYETVVYVAKVTACAIVARNPERFGLGDLEIHPPAPHALVSVSGGTSLGRIARAAGIGVGELAKLNPELKRKRVPPDVLSWSVRLPVEKLERFERKWKDFKPAGKTHAAHTLRFGERLKDVAAMYGTTSRRLRALNDLRDGELRAGIKLQVPDVEPVEPVADDDAQAKRPIAAVPNAVFTYPDRARVFYRVVGGDTGEEIAAFFGVTMDDLRRWNGVTPEAKLPSGMMLQLFVPQAAVLSRAVVWTPEEVRILTVGSESFFNFHEAQRDRKRIRYRYKAGDTLAKVAKRHGLSVGSIARINRFSRYSKPKPGSELILYVPNE